MKFNQDNTDDYKVIGNKIRPITQIENIEELNYLYPNFHRITHQLRWFKSSRDRGFESDKAA